jgi:hypothetical protein
MNEWSYNSTHFTMYISFDEFQVRREKKATTNDAIKRKAKTGECKKYCDFLSTCEDLTEFNLLT